MRVSLLIAVPVLALAACKPAAEKAPAAAETTVAAVAAPDGHGTNVSVDYAGKYEGKLPCADCPGIKTVLTITDKGTYVLDEEYLEKKDGKFRAEGTFTWDAAGGVITLDDKGDGAKYRIGEGQAWRLDADGKEVTGDMAAHYVLKKAA